MTPQRRSPPKVASAEFGGTSATIAQARELVSDFLVELGAPDELRERAALAVSELASNAVQAAPDETYMVSVKAPGEGLEIEISVINSASMSAMPSLEHVGPDDVLSPRGRGLSIVKAISDVVKVEFINAGRIAVSARLSAA